MLPDDDPYVDGGFADEFGDDEFDDEPVLARPAAAIEPGIGPASKPGKGDARAKAKPPKGDDDFDDDDDDDDDFDDFGDDDDDEFGDSEGSLSAELGAGSITAAAPSRKLPWIPIAAVAGALVLVAAFVFRDDLFGAAEDPDAAADTQGEVAEVEPEPEPEPEPKPEPKPEPPKPAIDPAELEAKLAEATTFVKRRKHDKARPIVDEILAKIPDEPKALALLTMIQLEKNQLQEALGTAEICIGADTGQAICWITIATVEQENGNLPRALEGYRKYLELEPKGDYAKGAKTQVTRLAAKLEG